MAFTAGSSNGRGRRGSLGTLSEINVVPLVDVVLVLLIIFMLTAQVMEFGLEIDVPKVKQRETSAQELPVISMTAKGTLYLNETPLNINEIGTSVRKRFGEKTKAVYIKADKQATWDILARVVSAVKQANLDARLVTRAEEIAEHGRQ
ncbi:MAG: biopolymer transporter ExbD [Candidatus Solibacter usitatus]|nr:biopolymer transporter ExbD [Candidatus Solibacter usitatus]